MTLEPTALSFSPLGDCGARIVFGEEISRAIHDAVRRFGAALDADPIHGMTEWVCGYAVITVYYQPWIVSYDALCTALRQRLGQQRFSNAVTQRLVEIPVCYGGAFGPDLEEVAAHCGCSAVQVIQKHTEPQYRVYFLGFLPGFAYLGGLPPSLATPRRAAPRSSVSAGAVGIAGGQTGVYPLQTPGGWQIIGRTPLRLFDPSRATPSLLALGDQIKFVPIRPDDFETLEESSHAAN
jgi:KipI family sensor histidine kinase inhibitor